MNDPLDLALRHICETRQMVESLITSSESFNYPQAKLVLNALEKKSRELGKVARQLSAAGSPLPANVVRLPLAADELRPQARR